MYLQQSISDRIRAPHAPGLSRITVLSRILQPEMNMARLVSIIFKSMLTVLPIIGQWVAQNTLTASDVHQSVKRHVVDHSPSNGTDQR